VVYESFCVVYESSCVVYESFCIFYAWVLVDYELFQLLAVQLDLWNQIRKVVFCGYQSVLLSILVKLS
jgi:hypothetical protein